MEANVPFPSDIVQYVMDSMQLYHDQNKFPELEFFNQKNEFFFQCLECAFNLQYDDYLKYLIPKIVEYLYEIPEIILKRFPLFLIDLLVTSIPISHLDPDFIIKNFGFENLENRFKHCYSPKMSSIPFRLLTQYCELPFTQEDDSNQETSQFYGTDINSLQHSFNQFTKDELPIEFKMHFVANALMTYSSHKFSTSEFVLTNCTSLEIKNFDDLVVLNDYINSFIILKELIITQCGQIPSDFSLKSFLLPTLVRLEISKTKLAVFHFKEIIEFVSDNHDLKTLCLRETKMGAVVCELFVDAFKNGSLCELENLDVSSNNTGGSIMIQLLESIANKPPNQNNQIDEEINPQLNQNIPVNPNQLIQNQQINPSLMNYPQQFLHILPINQLLLQNHQINSNIGSNPQINVINPNFFLNPLFPPINQQVINQNLNQYNGPRLVPNNSSNQLINSNQHSTPNPVQVTNQINTNSESNNSQSQLATEPLNKLQSLAIDANFFAPSPDSISCLLNVSLKNISLRGIHWDAESALRMQKVLQMNTNVVFWDLAAQVVHQHSDPDLSAELAQEVLEQAHPNLEALFFSNHRITHFNFNCISHLTNLKALTLTNSNLMDDSLVGIEPLLNNLAFLDLSYNSFTFHNQQSATFLINCVKSTTLSFLFLSNNNVGDACGKLIFDTIRELEGNTHIQILRLRNCFLKQKSSSALIELLATGNLHLEELDVGGNDLFHKAHVFENQEIEEEEEQNEDDQEFAKIRINDYLKTQKVEHDDVFNVDFGINSDSLLPKPEKVKKKSTIENLFIGANNSKKDAINQLFDYVEGIRFLNLDSFLIPLVLEVSTKVKGITGLSICFSRIVHANDLITVLQNTEAAELWVIHSISDTVLSGLIKQYQLIPRLMALHIGSDLATKKPKDPPIPIFIEGSI